MAVGSIYYHSNFRFTDGTFGEKLFILLNESSGNYPYLILKTTSNVKPPPLNVGCNPARRAFFVLPKPKSPFDTETIIQLEEIFELSFNEFTLSMITDHHIKFIADLPEDTFRLLLSCLKKMRDDISERHFNMLYH